MGLAAVFGLVGLAVAFRPKDEEAFEAERKSVKEEFQKLEALWKRKEWSEILAKIDPLINKAESCGYKDMYSLYKRKANALSARGDVEKGMFWLKKAEHYVDESRQQRLDWNYNMALNLTALEQSPPFRNLEEVYSHLQEAKECAEPGLQMSRVMNVLANTALREGDTDFALQCVTRAIQEAEAAGSRQAKYNGHCGRGEVFLEQGYPALAREDFASAYEEAVFMDDSDEMQADALFRLGQTAGEWLELEVRFYRDAQDLVRPLQARDPQYTQADSSKRELEVGIGEGARHRSVANALLTRLLYAEGLALGKSKDRNGRAEGCKKVLEAIRWAEPGDTAFIQKCRDYLGEHIYAGKPPSENKEMLASNSKALGSATHRDLVELSRLVYTEEQREAPSGWKLISTSRDFGVGRQGYYGRAYERTTEHNGKAVRHFVISHRGTHLQEKKNLLTDFYLAIFSRIDLTFADGYEFSQLVRRSLNLEKDGVYVTHTGHSLGGAIAQVVAYREKCHAISFDSPGALELVEGLMGKPVDSKEVKGVSYVGEPNPVNTAKGQVGKVIRIYPERQAPNVTRDDRVLPLFSDGMMFDPPDQHWSVPELLLRISFHIARKHFGSDISMKELDLLRRHNIDPMVRVFNEDPNGKTKRMSTVVDWPSGILVGYRIYEHVMRSYVKGGEVDPKWADYLPNTDKEICHYRVERMNNSAFEKPSKDVEAFLRQYKKQPTAANAGGFDQVLLDSIEIPDNPGGVWRTSGPWSGLEVGQALEEGFVRGKWVKKHLTTEDIRNAYRPLNQ